MKAKISITGLFFLIAAAFQLLYAVPAPNRPAKVSQPDGSNITLVLHGDEFTSWTTTVDGYSVIKSADGWFEYVGSIEDNKIVSSGIRVSDPDHRPGKEKRLLKKLPKNLMVRPTAVPLSFSGTAKGQQAEGLFWQFRPHGFASRKDFKGICVPVHFCDYPLRTSRETIDSLMNFPGYKGYGLAGSVRDYFYDMSQGQFEFSILVLPAYTAQRGRESYGKNADDLKTEVTAYVLNCLGENVSDYDRDKDGYIDHISIIFAGEGQELNAGQPQLIWSHNSLTDWHGYNYRNISVSCIAEIDNRDNKPGIETYCHEFGHVLGLPDLYDTDYGTGGEADHPDVHDLMSSNTASGNPVPLSAFSRFSLGWTQLKTISAATPGRYSIRDMLQEHYALRFNTQTPGEFFIVENRTPLNKWQSYPEQGHGMLIFRVDSAWYKSHLNKNNLNADASHLGYAVLRADNDKWFDSQKGDFFPHGTDYTAFTDQTVPSSLSLAGQATNLPITGIEEADNIVSFNFVSAGNNLMALTGNITPDSVWGQYRAEGSIITVGNTVCMEKGICYGLLPSPTVNGTKSTYTGEENDFSVFIDLTAFVPGATLNLRSYATDAEGKTVYGSVRKIQLPAKPQTVTDFYIARKNVDYTDKQNELTLDLSAMSSPVLETYYNDNIIYINIDENSSLYRSPLNRGLIAISSNNDENRQIIEPTLHIISQEGNAERPAFVHKYAYPLSNPSSSYRIMLDYYNSTGAWIGDNLPDSVIIRNGKAYELSPADTVYRKLIPIAGNAYESNGIPHEPAIRSFNTSAMKQPVLYVRGGNKTEILIKDSSQRFYRYLPDGMDQCYANTSNTSLYFKHYTRRNETDLSKADRYLFFDYLTLLPNSPALHVLVSADWVEMEVFDMGDLNARLHTLQAIDNATVEVTGFCNPTSPGNFPSLLDEEYGICWSTTPEPSLENHRAINGTTGSFVCPLTDLPSETLYFFTYTQKGGNLFFSSDYLTAPMIEGQRAGLLAQDALNPITVITRTDRTYTLRVRFDEQASASAAAQGICWAYAHDPMPDINAHSQYSEGDIRTIRYYTLTAPENENDVYENWADIRIRPFIMNHIGEITYGQENEIRTCANGTAKDLIPKTLRAPCDLIQESVGEDSKAAYWKLPSGGTMYASWSEWSKSIEFHLNQYSYNEDTALFISPLIDQSACVNPTLDIRFGYAHHIQPEKFGVYAIHARTGKKTYLGEAKMDPLSGESGQPAQIATGAGGDSIFLAIAFPNINVSVQLDHLSMTDRLTASAYTESVSENNRIITMSGRCEASPLVPDITACGFFVSEYGDPLLHLDDPSFRYDTVHVIADENGAFSHSFRQDLIATIYVRAFATNENGTAYGDLKYVNTCGDYIVNASRLPCVDNRQARTYREDGTPSSLNALYCESIGYELPRSYSGILQLETRPDRNKIQGKAETVIRIPDYEDPGDDNRAVIVNSLDVFYRTETNGEWKPLPEQDYSMEFIERGYGAIGSGLIVYSYRLTFHVPKSTVQTMIENNRRWESELKTIEYSESAIADQTTTIPVIDYVTVEDKHNTVIWHIADWNNVAKVEICREGNTAGSLEVLQTYTAGASAPLEGTFVDQTSLPETKSYTYTVRSWNDAGVDFSHAAHKTMHLSINKGIQNQWNLYWNFYEGRDISSVSIYRGDNEGNLAFIDEIAGTSNTYTDVDAPEGDVYYAVEVRFAETALSSATTGTKAETPVSRSNIATNVEQATLYTVTIETPSNGRIDVSCNGQAVSSGSRLEAGSELDLTATANKDYKFVRWMDGNEAASRSLVLNSDLRVSAVFERIAGNCSPEELRIAVYPNPLEDMLNIVSPVTIRRAELVDLNGKAVRQLDEFRQTEVPVHDLQPGVYFLQCHTDYGVHSIKVVKK